MSVDMISIIFSAPNFRAPDVLVASGIAQYARCALPLGVTAPIANPPAGTVVAGTVATMAVVRSALVALVPMVVPQYISITGTPASVALTPDMIMPQQELVLVCMVMLTVPTASDKSL